MARSAFPCISCGSPVPPRQRYCPGCGYRAVNRNAWHIRFAPQIIGAVLGMVYSSVTAWFVLCVLLFPFWVAVPRIIYPFIAVCTAAGAIDGFRRWDQVRDELESNMRNDKCYHDWRTEERCLAAGKRYVPVSTRQARPGRCRHTRL